VFGRGELPEITVDAIGADAYLLDVRDGQEWAAGHAPAAAHLPMMEVPGRLDEVPRDRDVVVVCRVGSRSAQVAVYLRAHGFDRVANLDGGMLAWRSAGREMISADGQPARVL
jgi:rhodanese-related sulfurtransferase